MAAETTNPNSGSLAMAAGTTSTTVNHYGVSGSSHITLSPTNEAAASIDALGFYIVAAKGSFTVHHSSMTVERTYTYAFITPRA
jgi:uncharacterized protein (AIM24 family)